MHPILADFAEELARIDRAAEDLSQLPRLLAPIPLDLFGLLLIDVPEAFPNLRRLLPHMPAPALQEQWVGSSGEALLRESAAFVRSLTAAWRTHVGRPLDGAKVLDYGCGWGRLTRLLYKYVPAPQVHGVDANPAILKIAAETGIAGPLALVERYPTEPPFAGTRFDLLFAFSLFTNVSERVHRRVLAVWERCLADDGLLALTLRPRSYWAAARHPDAARLLAEHEAGRWAFAPLPGLPPVDGDVPYGDASVDLDYLRRGWTAWRIVEVDYNAIDPQQIIVFLQRR